MATETTEELDALIKLLEIYAETDSPVTQGFYQGLCTKAKDHLKQYAAIEEIHIDQIESQAIQIEQQQEELEQHRWIPVSERLPEDSGRLFAYGKDGYGYEIVVATSYDLKFKKFRVLSDVTHWKPIILPEQAIAKAEEMLK